MELTASFRVISIIQETSFSRIPTTLLEFLFGGRNDAEFLFLYVIDNQLILDPKLTWFSCVPPDSYLRFWL